MASNLPDYVASAKPVPAANRVAWYKSTAQTYAGIMLWFVFWMKVPFGRVIARIITMSRLPGNVFMSMCPGW